MPPGAAQRDKDCLLAEIDAHLVLLAHSNQGTATTKNSAFRALSEVAHLQIGAFAFAVSRITFSMASNVSSDHRLRRGAQLDNLNYLHRPQRMTVPTAHLLMTVLTAHLITVPTAHIRTVHTTALL